jgi:hypothetical protein
MFLELREIIVDVDACLLQYVFKDRSETLELFSFVETDLDSRSVEFGLKPFAEIRVLLEQHRQSVYPIRSARCATSLIFTGASVFHFRIHLFDERLQ